MGKIQPYRLKRSADLDEEQFTLVATQDIKKGGVIGFYAGVVRTAAQWNDMVPIDDPDQLWSFDLTDALKKEYKYDGPDLVLEASEKGNLTRFLQDASWWDGDDDNNNLQSVLYLIKMPGNALPTPFVCFEATCDIKQGQEMLLTWGKGCWLAASAQWVLSQAWCSWVEHITNQRLEAACKEVGLDCNPAGTEAQGEGSGSGSAAARNSRKRYQMPSKFDHIEKKYRPLNSTDPDAAAVRMPAPVPGTATAAGAGAGAGQKGRQRRSQHGAAIAQLRLAVQRAVATTAGAPSADHMPVQSAAAAGAAGPSSSKRVTHAAVARPPAGLGGSQQGVPYAEGSCLRLLTHSEVEKAFPGLRYNMNTDHIPAAVLKGWEELSEDDLPKRSPEASKWAQREAELIKSGRLDKARVMEITDLKHPVRFCTPPDTPAYGMVAWVEDRETLLNDIVYQEGEPIGVYLGKLHLAEKYDDKKMHGGYTYDLKMPHALKVAANQLEVRMPDLVVDNYSEGNESRYINCTWGTSNPDELHNVSARVSFDPALHLPVVVLYATRDIVWSEELLSSYGDSYWRVMSRELQLEHAQLHEKLSERCKFLEHLLCSKQGLTRSEWAELKQLAEQHAKDQVGPIDEEGAGDARNNAADASV